MRSREYRMSGSRMGPQVCSNPSRHTDQRIPKVGNATQQRREELLISPISEIEARVAVKILRCQFITRSFGFVSKRLRLPQHERRALRLSSGRIRFAVARQAQISSLPRTRRRGCDTVMVNHPITAAAGPERPMRSTGRKSEISAQPCRKKLSGSRPDRARPPAG